LTHTPLPQDSAPTYLPHAPPPRPHPTPLGTTRRTSLGPQQHLVDSWDNRTGLLPNYSCYALRTFPRTLARQLINDNRLCHSSDELQHHAMHYNHLPRPVAGAHTPPHTLPTELHYTRTHTPHTHRTHYHTPPTTHIQTPTFQSHTPLLDFCRMLYLTLIPTQPALHRGRHHVRTPRTSYWDYWTYGFGYARAARTPRTACVPHAYVRHHRTHARTAAAVARAAHCRWAGLLKTLPRGLRACVCSCRTPLLPVPLQHTHARCRFPVPPPSLPAPSA